MGKPLTQYHTVAVGNTLAPIEGIIKKGDGTIQVLDESTDTVTFSMADQKTGEVIIDKAPAYIADEAGGKVAYDWEAIDVDTPGVFEAEFNLTRNSKKLTFPNDNKIIINIVPVLA
jgi:hypothetical protein